MVSAHARRLFRPCGYCQAAAGPWGVAGDGLGQGNAVTTGVAVTPPIRDLIRVPRLGALAARRQGETAESIARDRGFEAIVALLEAPVSVAAPQTPGLESVPAA